MRKSRFTESQIVAVLKEGEAGVSVAELCRKHGVIPLHGRSRFAKPSTSMTLGKDCTRTFGTFSVVLPLSLMECADRCLNRLIALIVQGGFRALPATV